MKKLLLFLLLHLGLTSFSKAQYASTQNKPTSKTTQAKDLKIGDKVWLNGKWEVVEGVRTESTTKAVKRAGKTHTYCNIDKLVWDVTTKREDVFLDETNLKIASYFHDRETGYDNYSKPLYQRHYDYEPLHPTTWRFINFVTLNAKGDTTAKFWLGRPVWWMEYNHVENVGDRVWIELPEQGITDWSIVTEIKPCNVNTIANAPKPKGDIVQRPIIGKFEHMTDNVYDYEFSTGEKLGVTPSHPFYSQERQKYVPIGFIKIGEKLKTYQGNAVTLVSSTKRNNGFEKVINFETYKNHNFFVGKSGLLVHNTCAIAAIKADFGDAIYLRVRVLKSNIIDKIYAAESYIKKLPANKINGFFDDVIANNEILDDLLLYKDDFLTVYQEAKSDLSFFSQRIKSLQAQKTVGTLTTEEANILRCYEGTKWKIIKNFFAEGKAWEGNVLNAFKNKRVAGYEDYIPYDQVYLKTTDGTEIVSVGDIVLVKKNSAGGVEDLQLFETKLSSSTDATTNQKAIRKAIANGELLEIRSRDRNLWFSQNELPALSKRIKVQSWKKGYSSNGTKNGQLIIN